MNKKCTNSACRRTFSVGVQRGGKCPHCGKEYPRLPADIRQLRGDYIIRVNSYDDRRAGFVRVALKRHTNYRKSELNELPLLIDGIKSKKLVYRAKDILERAGCVVDVIPHWQLRNT